MGGRRQRLKLSEVLLMFMRREDFWGQLYNLSTTPNKVQGKGGEWELKYNLLVNPCVQVQGCDYRVITLKLPLDFA